jgi:uncharacterized membrane protein (UPF0127 family)
MIAALFGLAGLAQTAGATTLCAPTKATVIGDWGQANFTVVIADTPAARAQGLMNVPKMPLMSGMLFIFERPQHATFWMRNTLIPLDMLFVGPDGTILTLHENARPMDDTTIDGGTGVLAVLEINGGLATRLGIEEGDVLRHPAFGADAAAPCDG